MHRRRGSEGLNWNPQRTLRGCGGCESDDCEADGEKEGGVDAGGAT